MQLPCTLEFHLPACEAEIDGNVDDTGKPGQLVLRYVYAFEMQMPKSAAAMAAAGTLGAVERVSVREADGLGPAISQDY